MYKNENDFVKDYLERIEKILSREVPYLDRVGYKKSHGFFFTQSANIRLDPIHLEEVLNTNGLEILSVMAIGDGSYILSPDLDSIFEEENS